MEQLQRDGRERENPQEPPSAQPDRGRQQHRRPEPQERVPLEGTGGVEQAGGDGGVGERAETPHGHPVRFGDVHGPVGERVEPEGADLRANHDEQVAEHEETDENDPVRYGAPALAAVRYGGHDAATIPAGTRACVASRLRPLREAPRPSGLPRRSHGEGRPPAARRGRGRAGWAPAPATESERPRPPRWSAR